MPNLVVIIPMMSHSKWPTGGNFCSTFSTFLLITLKPIDIVTLFLFLRQCFEVWQSSGDIADDARFKIIFAHNFNTNREECLEEGVLGYGESCGDIPMMSVFKMANCWPFLVDIFNIFVPSSKTNRDSDFVLVSNRG